MSGSKRRIEQSLDLLLDQQCEDEQRQQIEKLLADDPALLDEYIEHMRLHSMLQWHCETVPARFIAEDETENPEPMRIRRRSIPRALARPLLVAAAVLVIVIGLAATWFASGPSPEIGWASRVDGVTWSDGQPPITQGASFSSTRFRTDGGQLELQFKSGATLRCDGPSVVDVLSGMRVRVTQGQVSVRIAESAKGFVVETPDAEVVDLGTEFGVHVRKGEHTDVVVFDGEVDVQRSARKAEGRQRLIKGEAIRVDSRGDLQRVMQVTRSAETEIWSVGESVSPSSVIHGIRDNLRTADAKKYYEIVPGGFREGVKAYVDRGHLWKSMTADGMPAFLHGADYIKTFNRDRDEGALEIRLKLARLADVYVLYNDKSPLPPWLGESFADTGDDVGLDGYPDRVKKDRDLSGLGKSIDAIFSVWRLAVQEPGELLLGSVGATQRGKQSMYGIVVVPVERHE